MDLLELRDYCLSLPAAEETTPFDETTLVYKVGGKMYACMDMEKDNWVAVKCDPEKAIELREEYDDITYAPHFHKAHWNRLRLDGDLPASFIKEQVRNSYLLVVQGMSRLYRDKYTKMFIDFETSQTDK